VCGCVGVIELDLCVVCVCVMCNVCDGSVSSSFISSLIHTGTLLLK